MTVRKRKRKRLKRKDKNRDLSRVKTRKNHKKKSSRNYNKRGFILIMRRILINNKGCHHHLHNLRQVGIHTFIKVLPRFHIKITQEWMFLSVIFHHKTTFHIILLFHSLIIPNRILTWIQSIPLNNSIFLLQTSFNILSVKPFLDRKKVQNLLKPKRRKNQKLHPNFHQCSKTNEWFPWFDSQLF